VDGYGEAVFDREIVEALGDDTTRAIARESAHLPDRERKLLLGIVREFEGAGSREAADLGGASSDGR
jgi:DNA-directed RNA polymerase specialized sigma24 family protein